MLLRDEKGRREVGYWASSPFPLVLCCSVTAEASSE